MYRILKMYQKIQFQLHSGWKWHQKVSFFIHLLWFYKSMPDIHFGSFLARKFKWDIICKVQKQIIITENIFGCILIIIIFEFSRQKSFEATDTIWLIFGAKIQMWYFCHTFNSNDKKKQSYNSEYNQNHFGCILNTENTYLRSTNTYQYHLWSLFAMQLLELVQKSIPSPMHNQIRQLQWFPTWKYSSKQASEYIFTFYLY